MLHKHAAERHLELLGRVVRILPLPLPLLCADADGRGILVLFFDGQSGRVGNRRHHAAGAAGAAVFVVGRVVAAAAGALGFSVEGAEGGEACYYYGWMGGKRG